MERHSGIAADQMTATSATKMTYIATTQSTASQDVRPTAGRPASIVDGATGPGGSSSGPVVSSLGEVRRLTRAPTHSRLAGRRIPLPISLRIGFLTDAAPAGQLPTCDVTTVLNLRM